MPTPLRRRFRLARRWTAYAVAGALVLLALVLGAASQALPLAEKHPQRIAAWLSEKAGRPVAFDHVRTEWTRRGPLLRLDGLRVGEGDGVRIGQAEMLVSLYAGLFPGKSLTELRLRGLSLALQREADGTWQVRGLPGQQQAGGDPLAALQGLGELQVIDGQLDIDAPAMGWDTRIPHIDLRLRVDGDRVRAGARIRAREQGKPLHLAFDFDRRQGNGRGYIRARPGDLSDWSALLRYAGVRVEGGEGQAEAWVSLYRHRVIMLGTRFDLRDIRLSGEPSGDARARAQVGFEQASGLLRWRLRKGGWRLDAPQLRVGSMAQPQRLDGLLLAGGNDYAVQAERIEAAPLLAVLALSDRLGPDLRRWLREAQPQLAVSRLALAGGAGRLRARARLDGLRFAAVGHSPGVEGLGGEVEGDAEGFVLDLDPQAPMRFDWPSGFGVVHAVKLDGRVAGWREGAGLRVATPRLQVDGGDYRADVRGGLWFQNDGTRPWIDLAADLAPAPVPVARKFWVHHKMSKAATDWLDMALQGGVVRNGHAIASGDLDDWPFTDNNGRFEATGHIEGGQIRFSPEWPVVEQMDAGVSFVANGFELRGKGRMAGVEVNALQAGIADFGESVLVVKAEGGAGADKLLGLLKQSPLHKDHAETFDNLVASGPARVSFDMLQPLGKHATARKHVRGQVELRGVRLADPRYSVAFEQVRGRAQYDERGFRAEKLAVVHEGQPGSLSLRAGGGVRDPGQVFEAELSANASAAGLLDRVPEIAWLKPYVAGRSQWTVAMAIPQGGASAPSRLQLRSDLVGTALRLPAPLDKPAQQALPTTVGLPLPLGSGTVEVAFGKLLAVHARSSNGQTGLRVALGSDSVAEPPPASGLVATGRAQRLDALDWMALSTGGSGGGMAVRQVDVSAAHLHLVGSDFPDTRLQVNPVGGGLAVNLDGPALAGALQVPQARGAAISGRLARLHWRAPARPAAVAASAAAQDESDPAEIPPLQLEVDDLRFGDAVLGKASLRTQPVAGGMRVEQLQLRARDQQIDISGDWLGRGSAARTRFNAAVRSEDFGRLLGALGMKGRMRGGKGTVKAEASWPGSPAAFAMAKVQGSVRVAVHDGQLLEVEPGAGRVLGLLSVAQLPRRLMLDFRDFFNKGFGFNRIEGSLAIGGGTARTEDAVIEGPAAEISIRGVTDLNAQQFDQTIDVHPKSGNLLAVVGAVAGGPVGAAVGAAANAVLGKPLGQVGAKTYHVTGPWKDPKVEVISREQSRQLDTLPAAAGAP